MERIAVYPQTAVEMAQYILVLGVRSPGTDFYDLLQDKMFWFGSGTVNKSDVIFVFTGPGRVTKTTLSEDESATAFALHWGSKTTMLADTSISPLILKVGAMNVGSPRQLNLPQL